MVALVTLIIISMQWGASYLALSNGQKLLDNEHHQFSEFFFPILKNRGDKQKLNAVLNVKTI